MRRVLVVVIALASPGALADAKPGERKAQLCLLCHKPGNVLAAVPLLEAQPSKYLVKATTEYKSGARPDPVMKTNVATLSARDIKDISDYFAARPPIAGVYAADSTKVATGEKLVADSKCMMCHGATFAGSETVPRLAGQTTGYLINQLEAFAAGRRPHPPTETPFVKIGDFEAVAQYLTSAK